MSISIKDIANKIAGGIVDHVTTGITRPLGSIVDTNLTDITTTIGSFVIQSVRGKFQRSITFSIKRGYEWMEEALYGILYQYNPIKNSSNLTLTNCKNIFGSDGSTLYYKLGDGMHTLKYRKWKIMLYIQSANVQVTSTRSEAFTDYTIITYDLDPEFPIIFEKDMIIYRNSLLKLKKDNPFVTVYRDYHETDGYTTWEKYLNIPKRRLNTIYLPKEQKKLLVDTINNFMTSKKFYNEHGIPHNLKILLFGAPASGKSSITKMIASEWNRNLFEITGGKNGKFIPNAITTNYDFMKDALMSISDIDKYPQLINETDMDIEKLSTTDNKEETMSMKQAFNNMINSLDGITSPEDRIIVMTTNHIEKFSPVFLRPGRVDLIMEIGYITPEVFRKYTYDMYGVELPEDIRLNDDKLTIGKLQFDVVFAKLSADDFVKKYVK